MPVKYAQYDTQVEEAFIVRAVEERQVNSIRHQQPPVNAPTPIATASSPTETAQVPEPSSGHSTDPVPTQNPVPVSDVSDQGGQAHSAFGLINGSSILTPTPIAATSTGGSLPQGSASGSALRNIDLKDFETEQDPFENLSLRVMNDREELNKVFHVTSPPSQRQSSAASATTAPSAAAKPEHNANNQSSSLLQYSASNVANGLNTSGLNWVTCQPVPRWPITNHSIPNTCNPMTKEQYNPYIGQVSGPLADRANFPIAGPSYFGSSNFQPPQQPSASSMLRSAKSTPDISSLLNDHGLANARRTPPPVRSDWSSASDFQNREQVSHIFNFLFILLQCSVGSTTSRWRC